MKNEMLKAPRTSEARSRDYMIVVRQAGINRKIVWNDETSQLIDYPSGWKITKVKENIVIYDESDPDPERRVQNSFAFSAHENHKVNYTLPPDYLKRRRYNMNMSIVPLEPIQPPYKQIIYNGPPTPLSPRQLLLYQGVRHFLLKYRPVGTKMTAHTSQESVFRYEKINGKYTITAFSHNFMVKTRGKKRVLP
ncbi:MAG TPA: hypothetical protein VN132_06220, partial [Bdellovibrio sp.]|nr:hypothetical protein [Bdellovibrio sp.]